jgi:hypothetical protein
MEKMAELPIGCKAGAFLFISHIAGGCIYLQWPFGR